MKRILKIFVLFLLFGISSQPLCAQSDEDKAEYSSDGKGWVFGLNIGLYHASKNTAAYYNGDAANENSVNYVMSNYYWHQEIYTALKANDSIRVSGLPGNMHYKIAMQPGIYAQYSFNSHLALIIEFNYMKLKANDVIVFEVDPKEYATEPDLRLFPMRGVEERVYADIGLKRTYIKTDKLSWFLMGGVNVNSTKVKQCSFYVENKEYTMINLYGINGYVPNSNSQTFPVYQGGVGVGMFAGAGATLTFAGSICIEPGITAHWLMVNLNRYKDMNPGLGAYLRFLF